MLTHPTHERLITLGLTGMAKALEEQRRSRGQAMPRPSKQSRYLATLLRSLRSKNSRIRLGSNVSRWVV